MENNELNNRILRNVRSKIVVSNLESEENMKLNIKKQIISICAVALIATSGGFFTVNAATNGKLIQDIKDFVTVTIIKQDGTTENVEGETQTDEYGNTWLKYERKGEEWETIIYVERIELEKDNLGIDAKITENETNGEMNIEIKDRRTNK